MAILIWVGIAFSLIGLIGIIASIVLAMRARRLERDDAALRKRLGFLLPINLGALLLSTICLMMLVLGLVLG